MTSTSPPLSPTRPSRRAEPRQLVIPAGIVATGWPSVAATCSKIGWGFDPWQVDLNRLILAKGADGDFAADTAVLSIPRQAGKTYDVGGVVFAECIREPGTTVVWTAHRFAVSRETFNALRALAEQPLLRPHIDPDDITTAAGNECIKFRNGSRILFKARERGAIRGLPKVRILVIDEAQILTEAALADMAPTQNQARNPLAILMGTPPKPTDPSEVFTALRADALEGRSDGVLYVEYAAEQDADLDDPDAVAQANPSYPHRTPPKAIARLRKLLTPEDFRREALGIWDDTAATATVIDLARWADLVDHESVVVDPIAVAIDVTPDRSFASVAIAGRRADGQRHVEVVEHARGTGWVADRVTALVERWSPCAVVLDASGPAGSLVAPLTEAGVDLTIAGYRDMSAACGAFYDAVEQGSLRHIGQEPIELALRAARKRSIGDAAWAWGRKSTGTDISPLVAVTLALWGHDVFSAKPKKRSGRVAFA